MLTISFWANDDGSSYELDNYTVTTKNDLILYFPRKVNGEICDPENFYGEMEFIRTNCLESKDYQKIEIWDEHGENLITALHSKYALEQISTYPNFFQVELKKKIVESGSSLGGGFVDLLVTYDTDTEKFSFMGGDVDYDILVANYPNVRLICGVFLDNTREEIVTTNTPIYLYPYAINDGNNEFLFVGIDPVVNFTCTVNESSDEIEILPEVLWSPR